LLLFVFPLDRIAASELSKAARNERRKLTASLVNSISVALFGAAIVGGYLQSNFFTPIHITTTQDLSKGVSIWLAVAFGAVLHIAARSLVARMED
jgi:TRAP-type C4-dicarboxylate transport system permease small subunit